MRRHQYGQALRDEFDQAPTILDLSAPGGASGGSAAAGGWYGDGFLGVAGH